MRRFNPEKELKKIQYGNKNKVLYGIILLLLVISIGSSYALYQVRYSKRIIYTKVAPFNIRDVILSVKVDGESTSRTTFPSKTEGLSFSGLECDNENTTTGSWNHDKWSLVLDSKGPNKCTVFFKKSKSFSDVIKVDNTTIFNDDPDNNLRYAGKNPNNYIWFNCDDYDNLTQTTAAQKCEKWRIIGLFNNITKSDGTKENLVKIIKKEIIGSIAWDSSNSNNWAKSSLQIGLNSSYLSNNDNGTWITSDEYNSSSYTNTLNSSYKSITSTTLNMIENVIWNLGGRLNSYETPKQFYEEERGEFTNGTNPTSWNGYIGLMYPSDYGYATTGGTSSRKVCLEQEKFYTTNGDNWSNSQCAQEDWMLVGNESYEWTLTPASGNTSSVFGIYSQGHGTYRGAGAQLPSEIRPSLYLKSTVKILDGNGSSETPYILVP